jgi:hypothetical protein
VSTSSHSIVSLVSFLQKAIDSSWESSSHLPETEKFLKKIRNNLNWYLEVIYIVLEDKDIGSEIKEKFFGDINKLLYNLIPQIKGLCEGTTEKIPFWLALLLEYEFENTCKTLKNSNLKNETGIALYPVIEVNYYYENVSDFLGKQLESLNKEITDDFEITTLPDYISSDTSKELIALGFQYVMMDDALYNAILFHEIAHHIFIAGKYEEPFKQKIIKLYKRKLSKVLKADGYNDEEIDIAVDDYVKPLLSWLQELFCDCFGATIVGPAYVFAYRDICSLFPDENPITFSDSHPASLFRKIYQWKVMKTVGWIKPLKNNRFSKDAKKIINTLQISDSPRKYEFTNGPDDEYYRGLFKEFKKHVADIEKQARKCVPDAKNRVSDFWGMGEEVKDALEVAIVPSTIPKNGKIQHPLPSTILNISRIISEGGYKKLLENWPKEKGGLSKLLDVQKGLNNWTQKAIEDWVLIKRSGKA